MGSLAKSFRDGGIVGGVTAIVAGMLAGHGVDAVTAGIVGAACGTVAARMYRLARDRWVWLRDLDPGANSPPLPPAAI